MGNFNFITLRAEVDTHGLERDLSRQAKRLPTFMAAMVRDVTREILRKAKAKAPTRGDRPRGPGESANPTPRGRSYAAGNLRSAAFAENHGLEGRVGIDETVAPYAQYVLLPTGPKMGYAVFPDTRKGREGHRTSGNFFRGNPTQDFIGEGLRDTDIQAHVAKLADKAGNLPGLSQ